MVTILDAEPAREPDTTYLYAVIPAEFLTLLTTLPVLANVAGGQSVVEVVFWDGDILKLRARRLVAGHVTQDDEDDRPICEYTQLHKDTCPCQDCNPCDYGD